MNEPAKDAAKDSKTSAGSAAAARKKPAPAERRTPPGTRLRRGVAGVLVLLIVLAAAWISWPLWKDSLPASLQSALAPVMEAGRDAGLAARMDALDKRLAAAEAEIKSVRGERAQPVSDPKLTEETQRLVQRTEAAERAIAELRDGAGRTGPLEARLAALEAAVKSIAERPPPGGTGVDPAVVARLSAETARTLDAMRAENKALSDRLARATDRLAALEARAGGADENRRESAFMLAVGQLRDAVRSGRPYADALGSLRTIAGDDRDAAAALAALERHAASGVADPATLRARFAAVATRIATAVSQPREGWFDQTLGRLSGLISVRRTGPAAAAGDGPEAAVARAELALAAGDVNGAVAALDKLTGAAADAAAPWLAGARARIAVDGAVAELDALAVGRLAGPRVPRASGG